MTLACGYNMTNNLHNESDMNHDRDFSLPMMRSAWLEVEHLSSPAPWAGHIPFAAWLMAVMRPRTLVELGVYSGISYLTFCQAAVIHQVPVRMWGVDTWQGDAHAGSYDGTRILHTLRMRHDERYGHFSTLLQKTFDEALTDIADGSVDLLHIDGLHTYEAVRHDFETWLPKLSERGVVLFHDIAVREGDFGVWRYWEELSQHYPALSFAHSNGLGVLLVGKEAPDILLTLAQNGQYAAQAQVYFRALGERFERRTERLHLDTVLADLQEKSDAQHLWIEQQDSQLREQAAGLQQKDAQLQDLHKTLHDLREQVQDTGHSLLAEQTQSALLREQYAVLQEEIKTWQKAAESCQQDLKRILNSRSWRTTAGLRFVGDQARQVRALLRGQDMATFLRRARKALGYLLTGNWRELMQRIRHVRGQSTHIQRLPRFDGQGEIRCGILATPHTRFVAHTIEAALQRAGLSVQLVEESKDYPLDLYFVVCPQMFRHLPPGEKRIAFQMEQSVSSRWFTPEYIATLENSLAVLDYSLANIKKLSEYGIVFPHIFYAPIGGTDTYAQWQEITPDETCDVLFYGDANAPRRRRLLDAIGQHFKVRIVGNTFGTDMHRALAGAKVVVNIHYYEGALLETTRLYECLSLGKSVVSEMAVDQDEHAELEGVIRFVPIDDAQALIDALQEALAEQDSAEGRAACAERCKAVINASQNRFAFMLYRMLLAQRAISYPLFAKLTQSAQQLAPRMALALPELVTRREAFEGVRPADVMVFDGVRYTPGWLGAAMSYKYLAQTAIQQKLPRLEVMEDDVEFPADYETRRAKVEAWLAENEGKWEAFVGMMAIVHPDTRILDVERVNGETFVTIDRMISMVGNIYAPSALERIAQWDESCHDADTNTIDRFLQMQGGMRVVITLPFLLGHREDLDSSLWGFSNVRYTQMIAQAQQELEKRLAEFEARREP